MANTITTQDRNNIRRIFEKVDADLRTKAEAAVAAAKARGEPVVSDVKSIIAQNAIRACLEVIFNECTPYEKVFCIDMAVRIACYIISILPIENHAEAAAIVAQSIPPSLVTRVKAGVVMHGDWNEGGVVRPNIPAKGSLS